MKHPQELLSAYKDDSLPPKQRELVEKHLAGCDSCDKVLADYHAISSAIKGLGYEQVPGYIWGELKAQLAARELRARGPFTGWSRAALLAAATLAVALVLILPTLTRRPLESRPILAFAALSEVPVGVPTNAVIRIDFESPVDPGAVARSVAISPTTEANIRWEGNSLTIEPVRGLQPDTSYTISLGARGPEIGSGASFTARFTTAKEPSAAIIPPTATPTASPTPIPSPTPTKGVVITPTPTATLAPKLSPTLTPPPSPMPSPSPTGQPTATPACTITPVRGFGKVYSENPELTRKVGCPLAPEEGFNGAQESFERGSMFWRRTPPRVYVLYANGSWEAYPDTWREGEPSAPGTPPPSGVYAPVRGFGKVWSQRPGVREKIGWATAPEKAVQAAVQDFERGTMLWSEERWIYVLLADGTWQRFQDTFQESSTP